MMNMINMINNMNIIKLSNPNIYQNNVTNLFQPISFGEIDSDLIKLPTHIPTTDITQILKSKYKRRIVICDKLEIIQCRWKKSNISEKIKMFAKIYRSRNFSKYLKYVHLTLDHLSYLLLQCKNGRKIKKKVLSDYDLMWNYFNNNSTLSIENSRLPNTTDLDKLKGTPMRSEWFQLSS